MKIPALSKREFLKLSVTGMAACAAIRPTTLFAAETTSAKKKISVALQLYSVRKECAQDLAGTLAAVAKMGYQAVEFAGYHGRDARQLRTLLDDSGLKCCGTHIRFETLQGDEFLKTVEFNKILGNRFLIVPDLPAKYSKTRAGWLEAAGKFNDLADQLQPESMRVGYHNHDIEFKPLEGELPEDTFFGHTKKAVIMQFDTGNGMKVGGDPMVFLKRYPGRAASIHVKAFSKTKPNALLGEDDLPWPDIFTLCETVGGTEWYILEYESDAYPPLISVEKSIAVMRRWGKC